MKTRTLWSRPFTRPLVQAVMLAALIGVPVRGALAPASYRLETNVYVFKHGDFATLKLSGVEGRNAPESLLLQSPATVQFDGETLSLDGPNFTWSSGRRPADRISQIDIPVLVVAADQQATLLSTTALQYMEKRPDGSLELKEIPRTSPEAPHARLTFTVKPADDASTRLELACDVEVATVSAREKIPGVSLPVGKPVLARLARKVDAHVRPDTWSALVLNAPNGSDYSLLLLFKAGAAPAHAAAGAGPMTPVELDRLATHYYQRPQPELIGRLIEGLGASGFLLDRRDVFVGFFARVFAANPDRIDGWRKIATQQDQGVQNVFASALVWGGPGAKPAREVSVAQNDRDWGGYFASGDVEYLRRLAGEMHWVGERDDNNFWVGATAMWSLARNAAEHPAVRPTLEACRSEADGLTRVLIDRVLNKKPESVRTWLLELSKGRKSETYDGRVLANGLSGGERSFGPAPDPSRMGPPISRP
ncbi:MAG TPA: hypothetical protein VG936_03370 [Lacunisphaera sp.]|nr:hypothetical protein [Lacunisphaera sp.]